MVLAHSLFQTLKQRAPDAQIDVLAPPWTLPLLERMPEVARGIALPFKHGELRLRERWRLGHELRANSYDRAIVLPNSLKSAIVPWAARARVRTGFVGELRYVFLNDARRLDKARLPKTVERFVALGLPANEPLPTPLPLPRLRADDQKAGDALARFGIAPPSVPVLGLCPGAEFGPAKRWPTEHYAELARRQLDAGWAVWLFGSEKDTPVTSEIQRHTGGRCQDFGGRTSLGMAIDLMAMADAVVSNDSGLMHVAAALDRPLVALYGSSDPSHTPPMSENARVLYRGLPCSPCFKRECPLGHLRCLRDISTDDVLDRLPRR